MIKPAIKDAIDRHILTGCPTGDFVKSVLENKLKEAFQYADDYNQANLFEIVNYCYNCIPSNCWGSPEKVQEWQEKGGIEGIEKEKENNEALT